MPFWGLFQVVGPPASESSAMAQLIAAIAFLLFVGGQTFFKIQERKERKNGNGSHLDAERLAELGDQVVDLTKEIAMATAYGVRDRDDIKALQLRIEVMVGSMREEFAAIHATYERRLDRMEERLEDRRTAPR